MQYDTNVIKKQVITNGRYRMIKNKVFNSVRLFLINKDGRNHYLVS
jgi:hypothetical protein